MNYEITCAESFWPRSRICTVIPCVSHSSSPVSPPPVPSPTYISVVVSSLATKIKHTPNGEHTDYPQIVYQCYAKNSPQVANNSQKVIKRGRRNIKSYRASSHSYSMVVFFDMICYCWQGKTGGSSSSQKHIQPTYNLAHCFSISPACWKCESCRQ